MHALWRVLLGFILACAMLEVHAIEVNVQSTTNDISGLGFLVNGESYGGLGDSYRQTGMPKGTYSFGVRVGGIFGDDVECHVDGKTTVDLNQDTTVMLNYDGKTCTAVVKNKS